MVYLSSWDPSEVRVHRSTLRDVIWSPPLKKAQPANSPLSVSGIRLIDAIATERYLARIETEAMWFSHSSWSLPVLPLVVIVYFSFSTATGGFSIFMSMRPRSMLGS